jgi:hypothetical protein
VLSIARHERSRGAAWGAKRPARARQGRFLCRLSFPYNQVWRGRRDAVKQVAPVVVERPNEMVVVTVHTFFF